MGVALPLNKENRDGVVEALGQPREETGRVKMKWPGCVGMWTLVLFALRVLLEREKEGSGE